MVGSGGDYYYSLSLSILICHKIGIQQAVKQFCQTEIAKQAIINVHPF